jgi:hypothetical protein
MFEFLMDRLDMQNTVFCSSGSEPFRLWEPVRTFERRLWREYVKDNEKSYELSNHFKWVHIYFSSRIKQQKPSASLWSKTCGETVWIRGTVGVTPRPSGRPRSVVVKPLFRSMKWVRGLSPGR